MTAHEDNVRLLGADDVECTRPTDGQTGGAALPGRLWDLRAAPLLVTDLPSSVSASFFVFTG